MGAADVAFLGNHGVIVCGPTLDANVASFSGTANGNQDSLRKVSLITQKGRGAETEKPPAAR